jgi:hypothetical protein
VNLNSPERAASEARNANDRMHSTPIHFMSVLRSVAEILTAHPRT